jgi:hypothetical protein
MIGDFHDRLNDAQIARASPVHFQPNFNPKTCRKIAQLFQCLADLADCFLLRDALRQPVGTHLDACRPDIVRQNDEPLRRLYVALHLVFVGRMELASRAQTDQLHLRLLKALAHFLALIG